MLEDNVLFDFFLLNFSISMFSLSLCLPTSSVYSSIKQYRYESIELESFYGIYFLLFSYYDRFFGFFFSKTSEKNFKVCLPGVHVEKLLLLYLLMQALGLYATPNLSATACILINKKAAESSL